MNRSVKLVLYLALVLVAGYFFNRFRVAYSKVEAMGPTELRQESSATNAVSGAEAASLTNALAGGAPAETNGAAANVSGATNTEPAAAKAVAAKAKSTTATPTATKDPSRPFLFLGLFVLSLAALGALAAWDISHYFGSRTEREMTAEDFELPKDAAYEAAEEEWAKGNHLDAINLMRECLKRNPLEQHVAIRIAEIYEKDLNNYLAAVLELEEVLNHKLPREKWGWTAIHLANLYSGKLNQTSKALGVLKRIVEHYPDTAAARKARQRLGIPEPEEETSETTEAEAQDSAEPKATLPPPPPEPSHLPKGFRSKK